MRLRLALSLFAASTPLLAQEIPEHYHPVRPSGMGGAFTAVANDENSVWTNPAGITRVRKARSRKAIDVISIPNLVVGANTSGRDFFKGIQKSGASSGDGVSQNADDLASKPLWGFTSFAPLMLFKTGDTPLALGGFSNTTIQAATGSSDRTSAQTSIVSDMGGLAGIGFTDRSNRLNFAVQTRFINRYAYEDRVPLGTLGDTAAMQKRFVDDANISTALAIDTGFMWTLADFWFPTVGVAVLNVPTGCRAAYLNPFSKLRETVCGTKFSGKFANPDAISTIDPTDVRLGLSITPRFSREFGMRVALDMHHLDFESGGNHYGLSEVPLAKKLHLGVEFFTDSPLLPSPFSFSFGASQGYYTAGASLRMPFATLEFATFGRDVSADDSAREDRRMLGSLTFSF